MYLQLASAVAAAVESARHIASPANGQTEDERPAVPPQTALARLYRCPGPSHVSGMRLRRGVGRRRQAKGRGCGGGRRIAVPAWGDDRTH